MEHALKCWPEHYAAIDSGSKTCELRLNDRPYAVGDALLLREFEPIENGYTGRQARVRVTHILNGGPWLSPGYIAMSVRLMGEDGRARVQEDFRASADALRAERDALAKAEWGYLRRIERLTLALDEQARTLDAYVAAHRMAEQRVADLTKANAHLRAIIAADTPLAWLRAWWEGR